MYQVAGSVSVATLTHHSAAIDRVATVVATVAEVSSDARVETTNATSDRYIVTIPSYQFTQTRQRQKNCV